MNCAEMSITNSKDPMREKKKEKKKDVSSLLTGFV